jgi:CelD/BcsL family acetyltransferase involved in cellulose biosynthesis
VIEFTCIYEERELRRLRPRWEELWRRDPTATPFQSPGWLLACWQCFGTAEERVLIARDGEELVGILPLYMLRETGCCKLLPIGVGVSDYIDMLIAPGCQQIGDLLFREMSNLDGWDEAWLPDLDPNGHLARARSPAALIEDTCIAEPCPVLALPCTDNGLRSAIPRKALRDLHQARTRAAQVGRVEIVQVGLDDLAAAMTDLFELHERRWGARGEGGVCRDPQVQAFHRAAAAQLLTAGMLRLYRLSFGDQAIAVFYGFAAKGASYAYIGGFDPGLPRLSPGSLLLGHAIERAAAEGCRQFDFLRGSEAYKYAWGAVDRRKLSRRLRRR